MVISGHSSHISHVKWGGSNLIYTASHDRTVKVWRASDVSLSVANMFPHFTANFFFFFFHLFDFDYFNIFIPTA